MRRVDFCRTLKLDAEYSLMLTPAAPMCSFKLSVNLSSRQLMSAYIGSNMCLSSLQTFNKLSFVGH